MADYFRKTKSLYSSTTNSFGTGEGETITPASVSGLPTDTEIVLTFDKDVAGKLERIKGNISGLNFVVASGGRGYDNTTEQAHTSPTVEYVPNAADINDMVTGILVGHSQAGVHTPASTTVSGTVELATTAETTTGTDATRAVTPDGLHDMTSLAGATWFLDEDTMSSNSDTKVPSQQSVKAYIDSGTVTFTNKRITKRVVSATSYTTDTGTSLNSDNLDLFVVTAQAGALKFNNPGGTPTQGQSIIIRVKDNGTARALTYDTQFRAMGTALPSTTVLSKTLYMGFIYNSTDTKWDLIAAAQET